MKKLYRFACWVPRQGDVEGTFAAEEEEVAKCIGKVAQFGEILGKHSDVSIVLEEKHLKVLCEDGAFIEQAQSYGLIPTGHNPVSRILYPDEEPESDDTE